MEFGLKRFFARIPMLERFAAYQFTVQQYDFLSYSRMQQPNAQLKPVLYEVRE